MTPRMSQGRSSETWSSTDLPAVLRRDRKCTPGRSVGHRARRARRARREDRHTRRRVRVVDEVTAEDAGRLAAWAPSGTLRPRRRFRWRRDRPALVEVRGLARHPVVREAEERAAPRRVADARAPSSRRRAPPSSARSCTACRAPESPAPECDVLHARVVVERHDRLGHRERPAGFGTSQEVKIPCTDLCTSPRRSCRSCRRRCGRSEAGSRSLSRACPSSCRGERRRAPPSGASAPGRSRRAPRAWRSCSRSRSARGPP